MKKIKILCIEDSTQDLVLLQRNLAEEGLQFDLEHISSLSALRESLRHHWDILLSDYHLGGFTATDVLKTVTEERSLVPVLVVSGAIHEEDAVDLMKLGARDFVRKDNFARLVPAILRELSESEQRYARMAAETALHSHREFMSRILQSTEDSIVILDIEGRIVSNKLGSSSRFGLLDGSDTKGRSFLELWQGAEDRTAAQSALEKAKAGGVGKFVGTHWLDAAKTSWNVVITPIFESHSKPNQLLVVARDVTMERRQTDELRIRTIELKEALVQAESANQMKTSFLANMSHEIRTPIGAMMGFAELFLDPMVSEQERREFLEVIKRNGEVVLRLLNEILDLSKVEAGHLEIELLDCSLKTLIDESMAEMRLRAEEKGLSFLIEYGATVKGHIRTDPTRLKQILSNLVGNAIKFTQQGAVSLLVETEDRESQDFLKFTVKDSGIGIRQEDQSKLFQSFTQVDSSLTRRFGGTGLGLALSKRLAKALGGDVFIKNSTPEVGTEFVAFVKNEAASSKNMEEKSAARPAMGSKQLDGVKILLVEDSLDNQELLQRVLGNQGAILEMAATGEEGIEMAMRHSPHVVLMDLQMPVMDGMSATKQLRQRQYQGPIVALTAHAMKENKEECLRSGFNGYISKPVDFNELVSLVNELTHF